MANAKRSWWPIVAGVAVLLVFLGVGAAVVGVALFRENVQMERGASESAAADAFASTLRAFPDPRPVLEFDEHHRAHLVPGIESRKNPGTISVVQVVAWDPDERALARVALPMWLLRLKSGPIQFGQHVSGIDADGVRLTPQDIEKYGPGVLFEITRPSGEHVLVSAQ